MRHNLSCSLLIAAATLSVPAVAQAGYFFNPYWNLDARVSFVPTTVSYNVPTGYWYGGYGYTYGGYLYSPYIGSYYGYGSYYPYYSSYYNWYSYPYVYGFVDSLHATWTGLVPVTTYWNSWYWDAPGTGHTLDVISAGDDLGHLAGLPDGFSTDFTMSSHTLEVHSGDVVGAYDTGSFSDLTYLALSDVPAYVAALPGMTPDVYDAFIGSSLYQLMLTDIGPNGRVALSVSNWSFIPEPTAAATIAGLPLLLRRRR